jgi:IPT/TIG domain
MRMRSRHVGLVTALAVAGSVLAGSAAAVPMPSRFVGVVPDRAVAGQLVTIHGQHLEGTREVAIGGHAVQAITVDPHGQWVKVHVPPAVGPGNAHVTLDAHGMYSFGALTIVPEPLPRPAAEAPEAVDPAYVVVAPRIEHVGMTAGSVGSKLSIYGSNFVRVSAVKFGGVAARFSAVSSTRIVATVPKGAKSGQVSVHTAGGNGISESRFTVVRGPAL